MENICDLLIKKLIEEKQKQVRDNLLVILV